MAYDPANRGGADGSNYTFSRTSSGMGNWNTGGAPVARGSFQRGFSPLGQGALNRRGLPYNSSYRSKITPAVAIPPVAVPPPIPRMNPFAKFSGPPTFTPRGIDPTQNRSPISYGPLGGGKYQDRLPSMDRLPGMGLMNSDFSRRGMLSGRGRGRRSGGGSGGGGGGGW